MTDKVYIITLNEQKVASSRIADIPKFKRKKKLKSNLNSSFELSTPTVTVSVRKDAYL